MTTEEIISKIIKLEHEITNRIINDGSFKASVDDEYKEHRKELNRLRKILFPEKYKKQKKPKKHNNKNKYQE